MTTQLTDRLPLVDTQAPHDAAGVAQVIRAAGADVTPIYPIGGGTSLDFGLPAKKPGRGLLLENMARVVDYPARDMTITVEAGMKIAQLADTLAAERQWLPIDVPQADTATVGGIVATAMSGARRYGWGTLRDYVIGIEAVDGRGTIFHGGGRVVKNVAGYDFCKLLTGSLGTLAVVTQVTFKIRPLPERSALMAIELPNLVVAEQRLAALVTSAVTPSAIELLVGGQWDASELFGPLAAGSVGRLVVGLEGTAAEVAWMMEKLAAEWQAANVDKAESPITTFVDQNAATIWDALREFPAAGESPLVIKASLRPSGVTRFVDAILKIDPQAAIQAHAGNGIVVVRFKSFPPAELSRSLVGRLQPAAEADGGGLVVLSSEGLGELTRQAQWGGTTSATRWMTAVKRQFDPQDLLNPGRFIYESL